REVRADGVGVPLDAVALDVGDADDLAGPGRHQAAAHVAAARGEQLLGLGRVDRVVPGPRELLLPEDLERLRIRVAQRLFVLTPELGPALEGRVALPEV